MKIQILGTGCPKCRLLEENARSAASSLGLEADIEKITDIDEMIGMGVMMTPALAIDGDVKVVGKVLTKDQIMGLLRGDK